MRVLGEEGERDMVKGGYVGTLCGLSVANSEECNSVQKISRKKKDKSGLVL